MFNVPAAFGSTSKRTGAAPLTASQRSASTSSGGAGARQATSPEATPTTSTHARKTAPRIARLWTSRRAPKVQLPHRISEWSMSRRPHAAALCSATHAKRGPEGISMAQPSIQSVLLEERTFEPPPDFAARARLSKADLASLHARAKSDPQGFWADLARRELEWHKPFTVTLDESKAPNYRWFTDGELSVSHNCLDVHLAERGHKTALIFEGEPGDTRRLSYRELHAQV